MSSVQNNFYLSMDAIDPDWSAGIEVYDESCVSIGGGICTLKAIRQIPPGDTNFRGSYKTGILASKVGPDMSTSWCSYCRIRYGIIEMSAKIPSGAIDVWDVWPAFWLYSGPSEIDILDNISANTNLHLGSGVIAWEKFPPSNTADWEFINDCFGCNDTYSSILEYNAGDIVVFDKKYYRAKNNVGITSYGRDMKMVGYDLSQDYNLYSVAWTPTKITFFLNGRELYTFNNSQITLSDASTFLRANLQIHDGATLPEYNMYINYIRIWKPNGGNYNLPYKSSHESIHHDITTNDGNNSILFQLVNSDHNSISANTNDQDEVFYRGTDDRLYVCRKDAIGWECKKLEFNDGATIANGKTISDIRYLPTADIILYKGGDGRIQYFGRSSIEPSGWYHWYIDDDWTRTISKASSKVGSLVVSDDGEIFYRGEDNKVHRFYSTGSGWTHQIIGTYTSSTLVDGDITVENGSNNIYYRGVNGKLLSFYKNTSGTYTRNNQFTLMPAPLISNQSGSIAVAQGRSAIFYKGTDNAIHKYQWTATGWQVEQLSYTYMNASGYSPDRPFSNIIWDQTFSRLEYVGSDGRLQAFDLSGTEVAHWWIDDYWNTNAFITNGHYYTPYNAAASASLSKSLGGTFYRDINLHLAYFNYELCEVLNPSGIGSGNPPIVHKGSDATSPINSSNHVAGRDAKLGEDNLVVIPNPALDKISLIINTEPIRGNIKYTITDARQSTVSEGLYDGMSININQLPKGMYFIKIHSNNTYIGKFIKL